MNFRFVAVTEVEISVDPTEFTGLSVSDATEILEEMIAEEYPEVDVPYDDIVLAADELVTVACAIES